MYVIQNIVTVEQFKKKMRSIMMENFNIGIVGLQVFSRLIG